MATDHRAELQKIRALPSLIRYLRDEMGWPIEQDSFEDHEDLFYDFTPEELGLDPKTAAKIESIKRLRPLSALQPWGIFFVKFEPKALPVVVLRRILSQVARKKRASANSAERAAWAVDDLLFVSNYGEGEERQISFAHFTQDGSKNNLPTLNVLGWDNLDTPLHLDHVAKKLTEQLAWPADDGSDVEAWRRQWRSAFDVRHRQGITEAKVLSERLAELARVIRDRIKTALAHEIKTGPLTMLMKAFQKALVHDLDEDGFADMYAQTIAYGLLSARIADPLKTTLDDFASHMRTNPFLRELMETFIKIGGRRGTAGGAWIDFDELGVSEVVELLDDANMEAVVRDFGDRNPLEDPVIHFYEHFLAAYDKKQKVSRGVFYTPRPVVSYIVRSVDELLRTEFGLEDGLADTATWSEMAKRHEDLTTPEGFSPEQDFVQILDPATGTGTFLVEVIDLIHKTMTEKWQAESHGTKKIEQLWNDYVPKHLLPRLHGYELLMAPYAIAHMKIGLKLYETGYRFGSDARARIYLTNALEPAQDSSGTFAFAIPALAHESRAVNEIKRKHRFTVVIGNPPYSGHSANENPWVNSLLRSRLPDGTHGYFEVDGAPLNERNPKWLNDDYVKFIRYGQLCVCRAAYGVLDMITNHGYFDNPTFRGMRESLLISFPKGFVADLHGNVKKAIGKRDDDNVFDIQQGVGIGVWLRIPQHLADPRILHGEIVGKRAHKYDQLLRETISSTAQSNANPVSPFYLFVPQSAPLRDEFSAGVSLPEVFPTNTMGITTGRDQLCVSFTVREAMQKMADFTSDLTESELAAQYGLSNKSGWNILRARKIMRDSEVSKSRCRSFAYRPFDVRTIYLDAAIVGRPRLEVMSHMMKPANVALCATRQINGEFRHVFCTRLPANDCFVSLASGERTYLFPLTLRSDKTALLRGSVQEVNLSLRFQQLCAARFRGGYGADRTTGELPASEDIFHYIYAVLHSPNYRIRYNEFLRIEFPRVPFPGSLELFYNLARRGGELVALHLMESPMLDEHITTLVGSGEFQVEKASYSDNTVWLDKAKAHGFQGVPEEVWNFHIGGYQVCEKWLKDRQAKGGKNPHPGRMLSEEDIAHYQKIVVALNETIRLMQEIDEVIDQHGGWPNAFQVEFAADEPLPPASPTSTP